MTRPRMTRVEFEYLKSILSRYTAPYDVFLHLMATTSRRMDEVLKTRPQDVSRDFKRLYINASKNSYSGHYALTAEQSEFLMHAVKGCPRNKPIISKLYGVSRAAVKTYLCQRMRNLTDGLFKPHDLRHACAYLAIEAKAPLIDVSSFLGHKNIQSTMTYVRQQSSDNVGSLLNGGFSHD